MTAILCIETSAPSIMVALGESGRVLFEDTPEGRRVDGPVYLADAVRRGLAGTGLRKNDIGAVAVDLGPGGLTATRGGVTFANALAWGLGIPLVPLDYFDLVTAETKATTTVVCIRPTTAGQGFFREGKGQPMVDDLAKLARQCRARPPDIVLAGVVTPDVTALFPGSGIGAAEASAATLVRCAGEALAAGRCTHEPLEPLTAASLAAGCEDRG
ncbi:MAG: tRNA (adenosine(37)-N6)-threonylcarbamoyltransferase complex dimerization subunit type 1 TsaB [bacterium]|nr:tRNA (adenosine(37)-N6)-threonylcarbamoyltransferase complex dimerization subunit type 1 TsaB [bacterium]MDE0417766.1 tRNA (adenosine(37)-N6)-threonylcarbamoyltransferase complex dimerization subunit type 1 TsaB [bacterium]